MEESESICNIIGEAQQSVQWADQRVRRSSFRFIARKSPQLSVQSHSLLLVVDLVGGSLSQSKAGRQADLKSLPSECTRAKFPIIHDSNFQNRCSWSFLSPRRRFTAGQIDLNGQFCFQLCGLLITGRQPESANQVQ